MTTEKPVDWTLCQGNKCGHQLNDHRFVANRLECFFCTCKIEIVGVKFDTECAHCRCPEREHRYVWIGFWCLSCKHLIAYAEDYVRAMVTKLCAGCEHRLGDHHWRKGNRTAECIAKDCSCLIGDRP